MSRANDIQTRGICQCCGRQQAVMATGLMSKHGYTVEHGWFNGVCSGQRFKPMQIERAQADAIIKAVGDECVVLRQRAADLRSGKVKPREAKSGNKIPTEGKHRWEWPDEMVPFDKAPKHYQDEQVAADAWKAQRRAEMGESFCKDLGRIADEYHGKPLIEVPRHQGPAPIVKGEQRRHDAKSNVLTCSYVEGARVYWTYPRGDGRQQHGWTGTQAWRRMELITPPTTTTSEKQA